MSTSLLALPPEGYKEWLKEVKERIRSAQQRAVLAANSEMIILYWQLGQDILHRQSQQGWGAKVVNRLSDDLRREFPELKGFSPRNLNYLLAFAKAWPTDAILQEPLAKLPWYHQYSSFR